MKKLRAAVQTSSSEHPAGREDWAAMSGDQHFIAIPHPELAGCSGRSLQGSIVRRRGAVSARPGGSSKSRKLNCRWSFELMYRSPSKVCRGSPPWSPMSGCLRLKKRPDKDVELLQVAATPSSCVSPAGPRSYRNNPWFCDEFR
jgi:hypothetical protein